MLQSISNSRLQSPFILFIDSADHSGTPLFFSILKSYITLSDRHTHILCWKRNTVRFLKTLADQHLSKLHVHDCLADSHRFVDSGPHEDGLITMVQKCVTGEDTEINVVVDSLSDPLFIFGLGRCMQELQQILNLTVKGVPKIRQLLCLVHSDMLPCGPSSLSHLKHLASTYVELKAQVACITHRKPGGHVERKKEKYNILSEGHLSTHSLISSAPCEVKLIEDKPATLPQDVACFRVSLSDKEKDDRNKLVLPYMRTADHSEGGKVFYQPDAVDDWDDEDPDDDLDI